MEQPFPLYRNRFGLFPGLGKISQRMLRTFLNTFETEGAFLLVELGESGIFIPIYRLIFTSFKALTAVDTAEITPVAARDALQRFVTTEKGYLGPGGDQVNDFLGALVNTKSASGAFFGINDSNVLLRVDGYRVLGAYLTAVIEPQTGIGTLLISAEKLSRSLAG